MVVLTQALLVPLWTVLPVAYLSGYVPLSSFSQFSITFLRFWEEKENRIIVNRESRMPYSDQAAETEVSMDDFTAERQRNKERST